MKYDPRRPFTKEIKYDPNKRITPRIAKTLDEMREMLHHDRYARITIGDKGRLKAQAQRYGYKWRWVKEGGYYIITLKGV